MGMRTLAVLCMLVGSLVITGALPVTAASQTGSQTVNVNANPADNADNSVWTNTGFTLKAGLPVTITASGTADRGSGSTGPAGNGTPCPSVCTGPGLPIGSLIGRVGTGQPFLVGPGPTTVSGDGTLYLAFNDGFYVDNSGFFVATISYACQPGNGFGDKNHYHCGPPSQA
jgi:hypothetical protein